MLLVLETPMVTLCGQAGKAAETIIIGSGGGTSTGYTISVKAADVSFENVTIQNTNKSGQAAALMTESARTQFRNCRIMGYQDTLYARSGTQYFRNCYIEGRVDYIFGGATAVYENCEMRTVEAGESICAPHTNQSVPFGLVFLGGKTTATSNIAKGSQHLARNWGAYGATHYIGTELGAHINPIGWGGMHSLPVDATARFGEFGTTGPGADTSKRDPKMKPMTEADAAKFTIKNIFGSWTPSYSR
jgi:pectinesterase